MKVLFRVIPVNLTPQELEDPAARQRRWDKNRRLANELDRSIPPRQATISFGLAKTVPADGRGRTRRCGGGS